MFKRVVIIDFDQPVILSEKNKQLVINCETETVHTRELMSQSMMFRTCDD